LGLAKRPPLRRLQVPPSTPSGQVLLDFYCAELKLAIEVDGSHHSAIWMASYDDERTEMLQQHGIEILRIPNELLIRNSVEVEDLIRWAIQRRL